MCTVVVNAVAGGPPGPVLGALSDAITRVNADLWFGVDPSRDQFGGHTFASAWGDDPIDAHASYFEPSNPALQSMAEIVTGGRTSR